MTWLTAWPSWLLALTAAGALAALAAGLRRSRYDGTPPRVWWETQRLYRRPRAIIGRLAAVVLGAALLVLAAVAGALLLGVLLAGAAAALALAWAWWRLRCAARACAPRLLAAERDDLGPLDGPDDDTAGGGSPGPRALEI